MASKLAPISSTRILQNARLVQRDRGVERGLAAQVGSSASGRSLAMIFSMTSGVIGST